MVYVDFDPIVVSHSAARRTTAPGLDTIMADVREPAAVLKNPRLTALIDFDEPVGMVMFSVLHSIADDEDPAAIVAPYRDRMAPGSYFGISHFSTRSDPEMMARIHGINAKTGFPPITFRDDDAVLRFSTGSISSSLGSRR